MLLDIKLIKSDPMFCIESAAASVATWLNRNHEMMFSRIWGFEFLPEEPEYPGVLGKRIAAGFAEEDMLTMLKIYHGLQVNTYRIEKSDILVAAIFNELKKGKPVALSLNDSFLPIPDQKRNIKGFLLIVGYEEDESFLYLNLHNNNNNTSAVQSFPINILLNMDDAFKKNLDNYYIFSTIYNEHKTINYDDFRYNIRNCKSLNKNPFQAMRYLAECISEKLDYELEKCNAGNLYYVPLLYNIMHLMRARKLLSSTADYIWEISKEPVLYNLSMDFLEMGTEWNQAWNMLFKLFYLSKDNYKQRVKAANKIAEIADKEESLITKIVQNEYNCAHNVFINREDFIEGKASNNILFLDIKDYLNNKAFAQSELNKEGANFTGQGEFFLSQGLPENGIINAAGMKFIMYSNNFNFDNIICSNQTIPVPKGNYKRIMFLGCSEWGEGLGLLRIIFKNGHNAKILLYLPDWYNNKIVIDAVRVWKGKIVGLNNSKEERSLFAVSYLVNQNEEISEIQLPNVQNMHVFAISLEKCS